MQLSVPEAARNRLPPKSWLQLDTSYQPLQNLDPPYLIARLNSSIQLGDHQHVLEEILRQISFVGVEVYARNVLSQVPATTFTEILYALEPQQHVERFAELYTELSPHATRRLGLPALNEFGRHELLVKFLKHVSIVISARAHTQPLSVGDYKALLKCARSVGDVNAAKLIWHQLRQHIHQETLKAGRNPLLEIPQVDVESYNHYMATLCWSDIQNPYHRHKLRVSEKNLLQRAEGTHDLKFAGHHVGPGGLKAVVATLFQTMIQAKVTPNEETFCLMAISMAREGELDAVSTLLNRAWGLDVEAILSGEVTRDTQPREFERSDPLRPSEQLLMTLAHAYSVNKSISAAIQLVDHVSQQYSIPVSRKVWTELLERSVMLTSTDNKLDPESRISHAAASNMFQTMTRSPYNLKPDMRMYNYLINSELKQQKFGQVQLRLEDALKVHKSDVQELSRCVKAINNDHAISSATKRRRVQDVAYQHLRVKINRQYIRKWIRGWMYLASRSLGRGWSQDTFSSLNIPHIVAEYQTYLPPKMKYKTPTGKVKLYSQSRSANYARQIRYAQEGGGRLGMGLASRHQRRVLPAGSRTRLALTDPSSGLPQDSSKNEQRSSPSGVRASHMEKSQTE